MKTRMIGGLIVGLVATLALSGNPAGAGTALGPEIVDPAGDANFLNRNGTWVTISGNQVPPFFSQSTPVQVDGADLRAIWLETAYDVVKETDELGNVAAVRHVPKALRITFQTTAPASTAGTALQFVLPAKIGACNVSFRGWVSGATATTASSADISKTGGTCPGGNVVVTSTQFSIKAEGNRLVLTYPFSALPYSSTQLVLAKDVVVGPSTTHANVRAAWGGVGVTVTAPQIDETQPYAKKFRIGSDVPGDIDCTVTPVPAECTT